MPFGFGCKDGWNIFGQRSCQGLRNCVFVKVWRAYSLEPESSVRRFETDQTERRARIQLPEIARESELQGFNLLRNPIAELAQPSWFGKWTFIASFSVVGEGPEGVANPTEILRIPKGINHQRGDGDPQGCWGDGAVRTDAFHCLQKGARRLACWCLAGARKKRIGIEV